jgi:S-adenosylmethionine hydrolase
MPPIITLTTDFGTQDHYVGAMKAVMLSIAPEARFVDISHEIPPQDIMAGAWVLKNSASLYPSGTVHLVVVDPGVGTDRKPVALKMGDQLYVGPDNGIFSLIAEENEYEAVELTNSSFWREQASNTFHGRDIFAPAAAHLAAGVPLQELGEPLKSVVSYRWAIPISDNDGIQGWVLHIDRFGNLVTNIPASLIEEVIGESGLKIYVGNSILEKIVPTFGSVPDGEPAAYIGSAGNLEIAINKGNAQQMLSVEKGAQISIVVQK